MNASVCISQSLLSLVNLPTVAFQWHSEAVRMMWKKLTWHLDDMPKPEMDLLRKTFTRVDVNKDRFSFQPSVLFFNINTHTGSKKFWQLRISEKSAYQTCKPSARPSIIHLQRVNWSLVFVYLVVGFLHLPAPTPFLVHTLWYVNWHHSTWLFPLCLAMHVSVFLLSFPRQGCHVLVFRRTI